MGRRGADFAAGVNRAVIHGAAKDGPSHPIALLGSIRLCPSISFSSLPKRTARVTDYVPSQQPQLQSLATTLAISHQNCGSIYMKSGPD